MHRSHLAADRLVIGGLVVLAAVILALVLGAQAQAQGPTGQAAASLSYKAYFTTLSNHTYPPQAMLERLQVAEKRYTHLSGSPADSCLLCHRSAQPPLNHAAGDYSLNNYGFDYRGGNHDFAGIDNIDSDGDGFKNTQELNAGSLPGDKNSTPDNPGSSTRTPVPPSGTPVPPPASTPVPTAPANQPNLVNNPGFESGLTGWDAGGTSTSSDAHGGSRSLQITSGSAANIAASSNMFRVDPDQLIDASAWFKWTNVQGGSGLRMNLYAFDGNQNRIKGWDLASVDGSAGWRRMAAFVLAPPNTRYMQFRVQFTGASGTALIDDVYVRAAQSVPSVNTGTAAPIILPHPWQMRSTGGLMSIGNTAIILPSGESRLNSAADAFYNGLGIGHTFVNPGGQAGYAAVLYFGDRNTPEISAAFQSKYAGQSWDALGNEGYFLTAQKAGGQLQIYAGANSEQGRFYALQSIEQIVRNGGIYGVDVLDAPTVGRRGIIVSAARFGNYNTTLGTLANLKMNFAWSQGQFESNKFNYEWRTPLSSGEQSELRDYISKARANFVTPWISIGPRASSASGNTTCYSCDNDINALVDKFNVLYGLGLRNFGLNFDDLWNVGQDRLLIQQDINQFGGDLAKAHLYLTTQVYNRLRALHNDISMMIVPLQCYLSGNFGNSQDHYLQVMSGLPAGVGMYSVQYSNEDYLRQKALSGRPTMNWSNFFAEGYVPTSAYIVPHYNFFDAGNAGVRAAMTGLSFLPMQPGEGDAHNIQFWTSGDYFWAPERYEPNQAFQWAAAKDSGK